MLSDHHTVLAPKYEENLFCQTLPSEPDAGWIPTLQLGRNLSGAADSASLEKTCSKWLIHNYTHEETTINEYFLLFTSLFVYLMHLTTLTLVLVHICVLKVVCNASMMIHRHQI